MTRDDVMAPESFKVQFHHWLYATAKFEKISSLFNGESAEHKKHREEEEEEEEVKKKS